MKLSTLYTAIPEYIEFGWVTAPNAAGQNIPVNTITTLTLDTEVADTGNIVSAPVSNKFTLPAGTYYYETHTRFNAGATSVPSIFAIYNETDGVYVTRSGLGSSAGHSSGRSICLKIDGQMVLTAEKSFSLRLLVSSSAVTVNNGDNTANHSNATANADQRTTIKLWKLK